MKLPAGLHPLPDFVVAADIFPPDSELSEDKKREHAFVRFNELIADQMAREDPESFALARLADALGQEYTANPTSNAEIEARAVKARRHARERAQAAIDAGYRP